MDSRLRARSSGKRRSQTSRYADVAGRSRVSIVSLDLTTP